MECIRKIFFICGAFLFTSTSALAFDMTFNWGNIPRCTSGNPNTVGSPTFGLSGVPDGTAKIKFKLRDNNAPGYNHGGGSASYTGGGSIPAGSFKYKSPCPPDGRHTYVWTATALDKKGKKLGTASASKKYP